MSNSIVLGKLISGEIIIGKQEKEYISDAYLVNVIPNENKTSFNIMLLPLFVPISKEGVNVDNDKLVTVTNAPENIRNEYIKVVTDIIIPSNMPKETEFKKVTELYKKK